MSDGTRRRAGRNGFSCASPVVETLWAGEYMLPPLAGRVLGAVGRSIARFTNFTKFFGKLPNFLVNLEIWVDSAGRQSVRSHRCHPSRLLACLAPTRCSLSMVGGHPGTPNQRFPATMDLPKNLVNLPKFLVNFWKMSKISKCRFFLRKSTGQNLDTILIMKF